MELGGEGLSARGSFEGTLVRFAMDRLERKVVGEGEQEFGRLDGMA